MTVALHKRLGGWTVAGMLAALVAVCYWPVIGNIVHQWQSDDNMAHGWFVPLIVGYIVWERREELAGGEIGKSTWGLGLLIGSGVVACLGALAAAADNLVRMRNLMAATACRVGK